jgi:hypothetical protein
MALSWQSAVPPPPSLQLLITPLASVGILTKEIQPAGALSMLEVDCGRQRAPFTRQLNQSDAPPSARPFEPDLIRPTLTDCRRAEDAAPIDR